MIQRVTPENPEENASFGESAAQGAAVGPIDADLAALNEAWPMLAEDTRRRIVAMVKG